MNQSALVPFPQELRLSSEIRWETPAMPGTGTANSNARSSEQPLAPQHAEKPFLRVGNEPVKQGNLVLPSCTDTVLNILGFSDHLLNQFTGQTQYSTDNN